MNRYPLVLVNGYPQELSATDRVHGGGNVPSQGTAPGYAVTGDLWFDTANNLLKIYDGSSWTAVGGGGGGGTVVVSPTAPSTPANGSLWYDTADGFLKVYLAATVEWVPCQMTFFIQDAAPSSGMMQGDIWYSPLLGTFSMYIAGSTNSWIVMGSQLSVTDILAFG